MRIKKIMENGISKDVFDEDECFEYHIPVELDCQDEKECCFVNVNYQKDIDEPTFLMLSDMRSEDLDYPFAYNEMDYFQRLVYEYEKHLKSVETLRGDELI